MRVKPLLILSIILIVAMVPTVSGTEVANLHPETFVDGEVYLTPAQELQPRELLLVVNYADEDLVLRVNGTDALGAHHEYSAVVVPGRSSSFIAADFLDVETTYRISIERGGDVVLQLTRSRPSYLLPPPEDAGDWYISPPVEEVDLVYSEADWQAMIEHLVSEVSLQTLLFASLAWAVGFLAGIVAKSWTRFLAPTDPLSCALLVAAGADIVLSASGIGWYWLPLLVGYQIGFFLRHIDYFTPIHTDCEGRMMKADPVVTYHPREDASTAIAIQDQTWRGFARRILGAHHYLGYDNALAGDWIVSVKKPYWPRISTRALWVERSTTTVEDRTVGRWNVKQHRTQYVLADGSTMNKVELLARVNGYLELRTSMREDKARLARLELRSQTEPVQVASELIRDAVDASSWNVVGRMFARAAAPLDHHTKENEMNVIEREITEPKEEEEDDE